MTIVSSFTKQLTKRSSHSLGRKYFIEVLHKQGEGKGYVQVAWKSPTSKNFIVITNEFLSLFLEENNAQTIFKRPDKIVPKHHTPRRLNPLPHKSREFSGRFETENILYERGTRNVLPACENIPTLVVKKEFKRFHGLKFVQTPKVYPDDGSGHVLQTCKNVNRKSLCQGNPFLEKTKAYMVANKYLNSTLPG